MAVLEIKKYPNPILRGKCLPVQILRSKTWSGKEVKEIPEEIKRLGFEMIETMTENEGIGLSAPQVGELKRIIAVQTERGPEIFINPKILKKSKETEIIEEGCLSFPGLWLKIKRAKMVEIEAINEKGEKNKIQAEGLPARIFQHEIDHLDGILFIDRLSFWQRLKLKEKF
ncbi:MAG: peptide deformylase [Candidatus Nealsonbacteria bacterium CG23_combo_of_CG06-09_8_20_14_all_36_12]|uniref:Peptide deformylase n=1 Tax=Candidatus Nealsonbacteria bacterium CG23_combo_of_CG06-09_8_20_14_all_36_12 TaxID=1974718 RepID=A0A2G9Z009_9BACT|nr:MAG: peptide deformylase [Candidatus Nealsonbacteria bacterium CG23_combo_of_CG06-09_8_20_14_all_36_12]